MGPRIRQLSTPKNALPNRRLRARYQYFWKKKREGKEKENAMDDNDDDEGDDDDDDDGGGAGCVRELSYSRCLLGMRFMGALERRPRRVVAISAWRDRLA